jgi:hypothetical protein
VGNGTESAEAGSNSRHPRYHLKFNSGLAFREPSVCLGLAKNISAGSNLTSMSRRQVVIRNACFEMNAAVAR